MIENEMGYRGSKSIIVFLLQQFKINCLNLMKKSIIVKEQRVDGSYTGLKFNPVLRCTLKNFERNYQVRIPSNQIYNKTFVRNSHNSCVFPYNNSQIIHP